MLKNIWAKIVLFFKNLYVNLKDRLRPRKTFQWIFTTVLWFIIVVYIVVGIFFAVMVYHSHSEAKATKFAVKIYPFPVVIVNSSIIWAHSYYDQLNYIEHYSTSTSQALPDQTTLRGQIIDSLIENKIIEIEASRYKISVSSKDINDAYQKIVDQSGGDAEVQKVLTELYGMNVNDFKNLIAQEVLKQKIQDNVIIQVKVAHILIKDQNTANSVADQAKKGGDFAALAKQYSEDTKSNTAGGELGWLTRGQFVINNVSVPEFDKAAFSADKGDIVGPVSTSAGYEIIKIEDKKGSINQDFDSWLSDLKKQARIIKFIK